MKVFNAIVEFLDYNLLFSKFVFIFEVVVFVIVI